jgi:uncharacterized protein YaiI (UPF0178 family)
MNTGTGFPIFCLPRERLFQTSHLGSADQYSLDMTTIFIDADACPVTRDAIAVARSRSLPVVLVANQSQNLAHFAGRAGVEILQVASGRDSADFAMVPRLRPGDIVVTGDIGLAAMALGQGCRALSPRGRQYLPATIDAELAVRHAEQRHRRAGGRTTGPTPFQDEDRERFRESLARLLTENSGTD